MDLEVSHNDGQVLLQLEVENRELAGWVLAAFGHVAAQVAEWGEVECAAEGAAFSVALRSLHVAFVAAAFSLSETRAMTHTWVN